MYIIQKNETRTEKNGMWDAANYILGSKSVLVMLRVYELQFPALE